MVLLDENMPAGQRLLLREWRIHFRVVGIEVGRTGTKDENLIPVLHGLPQATFFSLDRFFFRPELLHHSYCLVWLDVVDDQAADFIRRFLRHPRFDSQAKRLGKVVRVHADGAHFRQRGNPALQSVPWRDR
jgi:hypothetical protein